MSMGEGSQLQGLRHDVDGLRQQVVALTKCLTTLVDKQSHESTYLQRVSPLSPYTSTDPRGLVIHRTGSPEQPQFIGPTRSDFSFNIAETTIARMSIGPDGMQPHLLASPVTSREHTPDQEPRQPSPTEHRAAHGLSGLTCTEVIRLLEIYHEEVACVHPIVDAKDLMRHAAKIFEPSSELTTWSEEVQLRDIRNLHMVKIAVATALIHETHGKNTESDSLVASVEQDVSVISLAHAIDLKDIQIMGMLSLYFCHTSEELYAWRAIGRAARHALEMGLHRRQSLIDNFKDEEARNRAVQIFWVIYELDRRWSFGTSLSFALDDREIDPRLPEPGQENPYLKAMVAFARLCSNVWEALPSYGSSAQCIAKEKEEYLDFMAQNWRRTLPQELQFQQTEHDDQTRQVRRIRVLLYLRGNYVRTLIHRHHVLTPENILNSQENAQLVVDIAKDSIQVLVKLDETSDVYTREQSIYHYYLISAVAVLLLSVLHAPQLFAETCRNPFVSAVELVKGFSKSSTASRRLWKSFRGLLPVIKSLSTKAMDDKREQSYTSVSYTTIAQELERSRTTNDTLAPHLSELWTNDSFGFDLGLSDVVPGDFDMSTNLMDLYDLFGSTVVQQPVHDDGADASVGQQGSSELDGDAMTRHFLELL
ncbi:fungal-specific transcription factor domain-containing protein [Phaeosphaeria sp. MPI-PUGE-AT-0046c]|nr:fungal-specific transcription factor domain-containing protein [Phaeosphaeria sp. MPI-PUGE-AT-0046c]